MHNASLFAEVLDNSDLLELVLRHVGHSNKCAPAVSKHFRLVYQGLFGLFAEVFNNPDLLELVLRHVGHLNKCAPAVSKHFRLVYQGLFGRFSSKELKCLDEKVRSCMQFVTSSAVLDNCLYIITGNGIQAIHKDKEQKYDFAFGRRNLYDYKEVCTSIAADGAHLFVCSYPDSRYFSDWTLDQPDDFFGAHIYEYKKGLSTLCRTSTRKQAYEEYTSATICGDALYVIGRDVMDPWNDTGCTIVEFDLATLTEQSSFVPQNLSLGGQIAMQSLNGELYLADFEKKAVFVLKCDGAPLRKFALNVHRPCAFVCYKGLFYVRSNVEGCLYAERNLETPFPQDRRYAEITAIGPDGNTEYTLSTPAGSVSTALICYGDELLVPVCGPENTLLGCGIIKRT